MKKELKESPSQFTSENDISSFMWIKPQYANDDYKSNGKLLNKYAVVTASDNGVCKAISLAFAKEGAHIVMVYNHQKHEKELKEIVKKIEKIGRKVWLFRSCTFDEFKCRSEEHTSELQSRENLVCRLLLEKKKHYTILIT